MTPSDSFPPGTRRTPHRGSRHGRAAAVSTRRVLKTAYVGLVTASLPALDDALAPSPIALNTDSALGPVRPTPLATVGGVLRIMRHVIVARLRKTYRNNPFFAESGAPLVTPQVVTRAQREALADA